MGWLTLLQSLKSFLSYLLPPPRFLFCSSYYSVETQRRRLCRISDSLPKSPAMAESATEEPPSLAEVRLLLFLWILVCLLTSSVCAALIPITYWDFHDLGFFCFFIVDICFVVLGSDVFC